MQKIYAFAGGASGGMPRAGSHRAPNVEEVINYWIFMKGGF